MYAFVVTFLIYVNILYISELNEATQHMKVMIACKMIIDDINNKFLDIWYPTSSPKIIKKILLGLRSNI